MVKKDYYEILGVKKSDSIEIIKKKYKKLVLKFHPDKAEENKKEEYETRFKEITEAYGIIGNSEKRKNYDMNGTSPFGQGRSRGGGFGGQDFSDIINDMFGRSGFGGSPFGGHGAPSNDLNYKLPLTFEEAVFGCKKEIFIKKNISCSDCNSSGSENNYFVNCVRCGGKGAIEINQETPWGVIRQEIICEVCEGNGKLPKNKCSHCNGKGILTSREKVSIKIPAGIDQGQTLKVQDEGNAMKNESSGDLFLLIIIKPHKIFQREGVDVYSNVEISFAQAALGDKIEIPALGSEKIKIKIPKGTESGSVLRLKGQGVPYINRPKSRGDQFIKIIVKTPKKLSGAQMKLFKELAKLD